MCRRIIYAISKLGRLSIRCYGRSDWLIPKKRYTVQEDIYKAKTLKPSGFWRLFGTLHCQWLGQELNFIESCKGKRVSHKRKRVTAFSAREYSYSKYHIWKPSLRRQKAGLTTTFARASHFFVHFFAITARLRHDSAYNFTFSAFCGRQKHKTVTFFFFSWTLIGSL